MDGEYRFFFLSHGWSEERDGRLQLGEIGRSQAQSAADDYLRDLPDWDDLVMHPDHLLDRQTACIVVATLGERTRHCVNEGLTRSMRVDDLKIWMAGVIAGSSTVTFVVALPFEITGHLDPAIDVIDPRGIVLEVICVLADDGIEIRQVHAKALF